MAYSGTTETIYWWTDPDQRNAYEYTISPYYNGSGYSGASGYGFYETKTYTEKEMLDTFARMKEEARLHKHIDQVKVTRAAIIVPSVKES
jgi:hypothetical protein